MAEVLPYALLAGAIGLVIGMMEIIQRYKAEPFSAVFTVWGELFCLFNGLVSAGAYLLLYLMAPEGEPATFLGHLKLAAIGGFGAAVVLRAKIITARLPDGQAVAVGPDYVVQTFLDVIDCKLDQLRARVRYDTVHRLMKDIDFDKAMLKLTSQLYLAMQSVSEAELAEFRARVDELYRIDEVQMDRQEKAYNLGYYLLDLVGKEFLEHVVDQYRDELAVHRPPALPGRG
jgi:hypothetical protein